MESLPMSGGPGETDMNSVVPKKKISGSDIENRCGKPIIRMNRVSRGEPRMAGDGRATDSMLVVLKLLILILRVAIGGSSCTLIPRKHG